MSPHRCDRGRVLPGWLPAAKRPNGAMLLAHLGQQHPDQVGPTWRACAPRTSTPWRRRRSRSWRNRTRRRESYRPQNEKDSDMQ
jgi:hypothetical protein